MEYSLFMIKPCVYKNKNEILDILNEKLNVLFTKDFVLNEDFLNKLYNNEKNETFKAINIKQLKDKPACIGIVSGENAIKDLIEICGDKPLGKMCDKNSIRYRFEPKEDILHIDNQIFFVNSIHKADPNEAIDQVTLFIKEFLKEELKRCNLTEKDSNEEKII